MKMYDIVINGFDAQVEIIDFSPPTEPITNLLPEDCDPGDPGELVWEASTGNDLLDNYIDNDEMIQDSVSEQLYDQLLQESKEAREEARL